VTHYVAVNICINCSFFTFIFAVLIPILGQFLYHNTLRKHQWFCLSLYNFHSAMMKIKGRFLLLMSILIIERLWREKLAGSHEL